jgi:aminopeptidase YwaD
MIGSRPAGSPAEKSAADGLVARLKEAGYEVELQPFTIRRTEDRGSSLDVESQPALHLETQALYGSASKTVRGWLVEVGLGRREDVAGKRLTGAIALVQRGEITFGEKVRNAARAGAVGVVIYNNEPGLLRGTLGSQSTIPAATLSEREGLRLVRLLGSRQLTAELRVDIAVVEASSQNVVAMRPGSTTQTIVLGAHYDSVAEGPGANDNASGTATALELARVLRMRNTPYTIRVVLFGAEEIGLVGSREYVTALSGAERERIVAMLNFDMVGVGDDPQVGGSDDLVDLLVDVAAEQGDAVTPIGLNGASDHASFIEAGIPAVFFYRSEDPNYHSPEDKAQFVEPEHLTYAGNLALALLERLVQP